MQARSSAPQPPVGIAMENPTTKDGHVSICGAVGIDEKGLSSGKWMSP